MNYGLVKKIYDKLPKPLYRIVCGFSKVIPLEILYGKSFLNLYRQSKISINYPPERIEEIQNINLQKMITHCYNNVSYYRNLFDKMNLTPKDIKTKKDLKKLPILTKQILFENLKEIRADNYKYFSPGLASNSGSTYNIFEYLLDQKNREKEYALVWRYYNINRINFNDKIASLRGDLIANNDNKLWKYNPLKKELVFATDNLTTENIDIIINKLVEFDPKLIRGYPSVLQIVSNRIAERKIYFKNLKVIITSSEMITSDVKKNIAKVFKCDIYDWYGSSEYIISAQELQNHKGYFVNEDYGIIEFIKDKQTKKYHVVATGLYNYSMPFIRFDLGDLVEIKKDRAYGHQRTIIKKIWGRTNQYLLKRDGTLISLNSYEVYFKKKIGYKHIQLITTVQKTKSTVEVKLIPKSTYPPGFDKLIISELKSLLGNSMDITVTKIDKLPKGKFLFLKSEIEGGNRYAR